MDVRTNSLLVGGCLRKRPDLVARQQRVGLQHRWAVKDPVALNYYHLKEEQWFLLNQFDGANSLATIKTRYEQEFAPKSLTISRLLQFCRQLHGWGLLLANDDQAEVLFERNAKHRRSMLAQSMGNPLAMRLPGIDASFLISSVYSIGRLFFFWPIVLSFLVLALLTMTMVVSKFSTVVDRLPTFSTFWSPHNLIWLMLMLAVVKICHELGHAIACKSFGAECNEIGVMILCFTPCLYCNVSDSWMLSDKWKRMVVAAAGIYVELILAMIAFFLWHFSQPGLFNSLCLNIVFVCSLSTLLFNGNPLLRYDGYYILSDLMEIPNLAEQSNLALWNPMRRLILRETLHETVIDGKRGFALMYGILSMLYRLFVIALIVWSVYQILKAYQLEALAIGISAVALFGMIMKPMKALLRFLRNPARPSLATSGLAFVGILLGILAAGFFLVPFNTNMRVPVFVEAESQRSVVAALDGYLVWSLRYGEKVEKNDVIAILENRETQKQRIQQAGEVAKAKRRLENTRKQSNHDSSLLLLIPTIEATIQDAQQQLAVLDKKIAQLRIVSPVSGVVVAPELRSNSEQDDVEVWQGTALSNENEGCFIKRGDEICIVSHRVGKQVSAIVSEETIELIRLGGRAIVRLNQDPETDLLGRVVSISKDPVNDIPNTLLADGRVGYGIDAQTGHRKLATSYVAKIEIDKFGSDGASNLVRYRSTGIAKIDGARCTIAERFCRVLSQTFMKL